MNKIVSGLVCSVFALLATGCTTVAPNYSVSFPNVETLKQAGPIQAKVGEFNSTVAEGKGSAISMRGNKMISPYKESFAAYVAEAVKQEFSLAGKLSPTSINEVTGTLLQNDIDAAIGTAKGDIQVRILVKKNGAIAYDQVKSAHTEWESSFAGAIAIPRATQEYTVLVQKVLGSLYVDPAFIAALK
ncbi:hypothetical protein HSX11_14110 [Oxalobacteraceae bacterium]|nr:hypothetical protein [Oxalobacteraceae bacterium]